MAALIFPKPAALNGRALEAELAAVGIQARVTTSGDRLEVWGPDVSEANRDQAGQVISAHTGEPTAEQKTETDSRAQVAAIRAKARAVLAGTDTFTASELQKIVAALVLRG